MKTLTTFILITVAALLFAFAPESDKGLAKVDQQQGLHIFMYSKPVAEYEYLGNVKVKMTLSGTHAQKFSQALKKCKKDYPQADGIIFTEGDYKADAIKFK